MRSRVLGLSAPAAIGAVVVILVIGWLAYVTWGSASVSDKWGPMAVTRDGNGDMARTEGVLRMTDSCIILDGAGDAPALLVWSLDQVTWDAANREILFERRDETIVQLRDGQSVVGGGSGGFLSRILNRVDWVAAPDPNCAVHSYWFVGDMEIVSVD